LRLREAQARTMNLLEYLVLVVRIPDGRHGDAAAPPPKR
jgi:hypothetical protein